MNRKKWGTFVFAFFLVVFFFVGAFHSGWLSNQSLCYAKDSFPQKAIEVVVRFGPGGGADRLARTLTKLIEKKHPNISFAVLNKPGANSLLAVDYFMDKPADGYTILNVDATIPLVELLKQTRYKLEDYIHLCRANIDTATFCIRPDEKRFRTGKEMIDYAKKNPGKLSLSTTGIGSSFEYSIRYFEHLAGIKIKHLGYAKAGQRRAAVLGGHVDMVAENFSSLAPMIRSKKLAPILFLSDKRIKDFPNVQTGKELGVDFSWGQVRGWAVKKGTPSDRVAYLEKLFKEAIESAEYRQWEEKNYFPEHGYLSGKEWKQYLEMERSRFEKILETFGAKPK